MIVKLAAWQLIAACLFTVLTIEVRAASASDEARITYRPIDDWPGVRPECGHPYTVTIFEDGRVEYYGSKCVREFGKREMTIPASVAQRWFNQMLSAGFLELVRRKTQPHANYYELGLTVGGRSNAAPFFAPGAFPPEVRNVILEIRELIDPENRWVCIPGSKKCSPPVDIVVPKPPPA